MLYIHKHLLDASLELLMQGDMRQESTLAVRRQDIASFFTSSVVGSRCMRYLALGCHRSYCTCKFLPAKKDGLQCHALDLSP